MVYSMQFGIIIANPQCEDLNTFFSPVSVVVDFIDLNHFSNSGKWGDEEIELLRNAVKRFGEDLKKISGQVKNKSV